MDVRIGIAESSQIIEVEMADDADRDELKTNVDSVLSGATAVLTLADRRGKEYHVPAGRIAFVEIGAPTGDRKIGFGA